VRIAWFTPFEKESAIGKYSKHACEALSKVADVEIFAYETGPEVEMHETSVIVNRYKATYELTYLDCYDVCVYNMGDNGNYHSVIYDVMLSNPGVVIAHDVCLHNFVKAYWYIHRNNPSEYDKLLEKYYPEKKDEIIAAQNSVVTWGNFDLATYSLAEEVLSNQKGVIVHSEYHKSKLDVDAPILVVPLIYGCQSKSKENKSNSTEGNDIIRMITVGHVNPNKHSDDVIEVLGKNPDIAKQVKYTIVGSIENKRYVALLRQRIAHYGLKDSVSILGSVSDEILKEEYDKADIVTNLRYPALEGGSASLCEQLMSGKVTIVCDTGVYSEVPDECVIKVNPMSIDISLANVYHDILSGKIELGSIRAKAREYALEHHTDSNYRQKVVSFLEQVCFEGPMRELLTALDEDVTCLSNSDLNQRLCNQIELLFGK